MRRIPVLLILIIVHCGTLVTCGYGTEIPLPLATAQQRLTAEFERLDKEMKLASGKLAWGGLTGANAREALNDLCEGLAYAIDCAAVDAQGRMVTVEPAPYRHFEGKDIHEQEHIQRLKKSHQPVLSAVFRSVEGVDAAAAEYPLVTPDGVLLGSVSLLFNPGKLLKQVIAPLVEATPLAIWVMDTEGRILYDVDPNQVGLNLFQAKLYQPYAQLISLARTITSQAEGRGSYEFLHDVTQQVVKKSAVWKSISLYGSDWRLIAIHVEEGASGSGAGAEIKALTPEQALAIFAAESTLIDSLQSGQPEAVLPLFRQFYDATPAIYAVQWIDVNGVNRFGYPPDNSLTGYDFRAGQRARDAEFVGIVNGQKAATLELPLLEGQIGRFALQPVFGSTGYLGMVYLIRVN